MDPFSHSTLYLYQSSDVDDLFSKCVNSSVNKHILTILRNPLEKVISQFVFFHEELVRSLSHSPFLQRVSRKILNNSLSVTPSEMHNLMKELKQREHIHTQSLSNIVINEYEMVFSHSRSIPFVSSSLTQADALRYQQRDISTIGVMEHMDSFLYLLSQHLNITLPCSCSVPATHGVQSRNEEYFHTRTRYPPPPY